MGGEAGQAVADEALRLAALRAIFPGMQVFVEPGKRIDKSWPVKPKPGEIFFPDALANETVYSVAGKARNEAEQCASENLVTQKFSNTRQVRFRLFRWPNENGGGLLAIFQYGFVGASPAGSCWSIGLLVHLVKNADNWRVRNQYLLNTQHHSSLQRVEPLDLTGEGVDELVVESDFGGAGTGGSYLQVFALKNGSFEELLDEPSRLEYMGRDHFTQTLDVNRTRQRGGKEFCFLKTALIEEGEWFHPPLVTHPCYESREGQVFEGVAERNKMLAPVR
jgi:hypothetical protein